MPAPLRTGLAVLAATALLVAACRAENDGGENASTTSAGLEPTVVATTSILGDVVEEIVGNHADVEVLTPRGVNPQTYEPTEEDLALIDRADLVVMVGLDYEAAAAEALDASEEAGVEIFRLGEALDENLLSGDDSVDGGDDGGPDPFFWMDPHLTSQAVPLLADRLAELSVLLADLDTADRADSYVAELRAVDAEISQRLSDIPEETRVLVTDAPGLGYFAARYDLDLVDTGSPERTSGSPLDADELDALEEAVEETGVPVVFTRRLRRSRVAGQLELHFDGEVDVVELWVDSLSEPEGPAATYPDLLVTNSVLVREALEALASSTTTTST